jgi:cytochrome c oxidase cbb3-type subunit 3/ubiquinol-cytochrome c reductase cytochrome c subunit
LAFAGCDFPGKPTVEEKYVPPQEETSFQILFRRNCAGCHGKDGKLGPAPPLNNELFLALIPDRELDRVIKEGRHNTLMPAFATANGGHLTSAQVEILAKGIRQEWGASRSAPSDAPPYLDEQDQAPDKDKGKIVFARACASCHGDQGQGSEAVGAINDPNFLALMSDQALRRFVITGRPDLGMPDYADPKGRPKGFKPLTAQEVSDLVAYLASWRH